jgi:hypothetical protein
VPYPLRSTSMDAKTTHLDCIEYKVSPPARVSALSLESLATLVWPFPRKEHLHLPLTACEQPAVVPFQKGFTVGTAIG